MAKIDEALKDLVGDLLKSSESSKTVIRETAEIYGISPEVLRLRFEKAYGDIESFSVKRKSESIVNAFHKYSSFRRILIAEIEDLMKTNPILFSAADRQEINNRLFRAKVMPFNRSRFTKEELENIHALWRLALRYLPAKHGVRTLPDLPLMFSSTRS
jgi:hypothetical protein